MMKGWIKPRRYSFWRSFGYAGRGVARVWATQANFRFQMVTGYLTLLVGWIVRLPAWQLAGVLFFTCLVLTAEAFNTAIEAVVDLVAGTEYRLLAGLAKDAAAGAVLLGAAGAFLFGLWFLLPRMAHPVAALLARWRESPEVMAPAAILLILLLVSALTKAADGREKE